MTGALRLAINLGFGGALLASASAAQAAGSIAIPEPSDLLLFGMGVAGLVIGRRVARKRPPQD